MQEEGSQEGCSNFAQDFACSAILSRILNLYPKVPNIPKKVPIISSGQVRARMVKVW